MSRSICLEGFIVVGVTPDCTAFDLILSQELREHIHELMFNRKNEITVGAEFRCLDIIRVPKEPPTDSGAEND